MNNSKREQRITKEQQERKLGGIDIEIRMFKNLNYDKL